MEFPQAIHKQHSITIATAKEVLSQFVYRQLVLKVRWFCRGSSLNYVKKQGTTRKSYSSHHSLCG